MKKWIAALLLCASSLSAQTAPIAPPPDPLANLPLLSQAQANVFANILSWKGWAEAGIQDHDARILVLEAAQSSQQSSISALNDANTAASGIAGQLRADLTQAQNDIAALKTALANLSTAQPMPPPVIGNSVAGNGAAQTFTVNRGQAIWLSCNYSGAVPIPTDAQLDTFSLLGSNSLPSGGSVSTWVALGVSGGSTTVSAPGCSQMYALAVSNVVNVDSFVSASGAASPATGSLATGKANELVVAYVETGTATNAANWVQISNFSGNLVTSQVETSPTSVIPAFKTTAPWVLTMTAFRSQ